MIGWCIQYNASMLYCFGLCWVSRNISGFCERYAWWASHGYFPWTPYWGGSLTWEPSTSLSLMIRVWKPKLYIYSYIYIVIYIVSIYIYSYIYICTVYIVNRAWSTRPPRHWYVSGYHMSIAPSPHWGGSHRPSGPVTWCPPVTWCYEKIPSGKRLHNYGKSPFLMVNPL